MGYVEPFLFHRAQYRGGRRGGGGHYRNAVGQGPTLCLRRVDQQIEDDRRAAEMCYLLIRNRVEDGPRFASSQADTGPADRRRGPGEAPAITMEH